MRFAGAIAAAGLAAGVAASGNDTAPVYVTSVVTAFTTYCPEATELTHGGSTYTVSSATTLTITHCPGGCTVTMPVYSSTAAPSAPATYPTSSAAVETSAPSVPAPYPTEASSTPVVVPSPSGAPWYPSSNGTVPASYAPSGTAAPSGSATGSSVPPSYNGAATYGSAFGAGLVAIAGAVAFL